MALANVGTSIPSCDATYTAPISAANVSSTPTIRSVKLDEKAKHAGQSLFLELLMKSRRALNATYFDTAILTSAPVYG